MIGLSGATSLVCPLCGVEVHQSDVTDPRGRDEVAAEAEDACARHLEVRHPLRLRGYRATGWRWLVGGLGVSRAAVGYRRAVTRASRSPHVGRVAVAVALAGLAASLLGYVELGREMGVVAVWGAAFLAGRAVGRGDGVELGREIGQLEQTLQEHRRK